jgi:hypothetical protein
MSNVNLLWCCANLFSSNDVVCPDALIEVLQRIVMRHFYTPQAPGRVA